MGAIFWGMTRRLIDIWLFSPWQVSLPLISLFFYMDCSCPAIPCKFLDTAVGGFANENRNNLSTTQFCESCSQSYLPVFFYISMTTYSRVSVLWLIWGCSEVSWSIKLILLACRLKKASDVGIGLFMLVAFSFIPVGFTMYVLNELLKKEKQLQFISGTGPLLYWFTAILWDMVSWYSSFIKF